MTDETMTSETILDLRGLFCPEPVLRAKKALRVLPPGAALVLECTDPLSAIDVPLFARQTGNDLVAQSHSDGLYVFRLIKRP